MPVPRVTGRGGLLEGLLVAEAGQSGMSAYAGKLLAALGAEVWKVEPPDGDWARRAGPYVSPSAGGPPESALFAYLNAGKRSLTADIETAAGRERLLGLLERVDAAVVSLPPAAARRLGVGHAALAARFPRLVQTWVTPFGLSGRRAHWRAGNLGISCAGGWASVTSGTNPRRAEAPPHQLYGRVAEYYAGCHAAFLTAAAVLGRDAGGLGEVVDLSAQETIAASTNMGLVVYTYDGLVAHRMAGNGSLSGLLQCRDGNVAIIISSQGQWHSFQEMLGRPPWAMADAMEDVTFRRDNRDLILELAGEWFAARTMDEVMAESDCAHLAFAPVYTVSRAVESEQLAARGYFVPLAAGGREVPAPGRPLNLPAGAWAAAGPVPALGEADGALPARAGAGSFAATSAPVAAKAPLAGIRVLDFTHAVAGPYTTMELAALGAEVIKVETQARPDVLRYTPPFADGVAGLDRSGVANQYSQGKRSWTVNLKSPEGLGLVRELVALTDVVVENFSAGTMKRLGLDFETLSAINPRLIMVSISGYGASGPNAGRPAFGFGPTMMSGMAWASGLPGEGPVDDGGVAVPDPAAALHSALAVLAALRRRKQTGRGLLVETSQLETLMALMPEAVLEYTANGRDPRRRGNRHERHAPHGVFPAAGDDRWISVAVHGDGEWVRLREALGLGHDPRFATEALRKQHEDELEAIIAARTASEDRWALAERLQAAGVAAVPVLDIKDVAEDGHLEERGFFLRLRHPETGPRQHAGVPGRFARLPVGITTAAPLIGEATDYVVGELLGRSPEEVARLRAAKVLW